MLQQQQQQTQMLQQFIADPCVDALAPAVQRPAGDRQIKLLEFTKLMKEFHGDKVDPTAATSWIDELEKAFAACNVPGDRKLSLAVFQLKKDTNNWWQRVSQGFEQATWDMFKQVFFRDYFPDSIREQMTSEWLNLNQGSKMVDEYELEFSRLLCFAGEGY